MRFIRRQPFLLLALITLAIGAAWHMLGPGGTRQALAPVVSVIGTPFIAGMRLARHLMGWSRFTPILGTLIGLAPYVLADWLLARWRARRAHRAV